MPELLYSTCPRRMEVAGLALYDVGPNRRLLFVGEGKGAKDRVVPIGEQALAWLERYLLEVRPQMIAAERKAFFVTDYGEPVSPEFVATHFKRYVDFAGVKKPGARHLLCHAMAANMLETGAYVRVLQALLGHAKLNTAKNYTHVSISISSCAIHDAIHPARMRREDASEA